MADPTGSTIPATAKPVPATAEEVKRATARSAKAKEEAAAAAEAEFKARQAAEKEATAKAEAERIASAKKLMRRATPDDPAVLRRVELIESATIDGVATATKTVDIQNQQLFSKITLLFDGLMVHVIHATDPKKSYTIPLANVAAMYPRE